MIAPNDPAILYSPYNWDVTWERAKTINAGAYFRVNIIGAPASIALKFDMSNVSGPVPKLTWEIDGWVRQTVDLAATVTIAIPAANSWSKHLLTVTVEATSETVDRWNTQASAVKLTGIDTSGSAEAPARRPLKILALGDSITEGVRTLNRTAEFDTARNSSRLAWSSQLGPLLDAECGVVGFGATGITKGGSGGAPALSGFWNTQWSNGPTRGVLGDPPNYILINMGTNDPDATDITALYTTLLNSMLTATTSTRIFCMVPFEGSHRAEILAATRGCSDPTRCTFVDTADWWSPSDASDSLHPYGYAGPELARLLATQVKTAAGAAPTPTPVTVNGYFFDLSNMAVPMSLAVR